MADTVLKKRADVEAQSQVAKQPAALPDDDDFLSGLMADNRDTAAAHIDIEGRRFWVRMWSDESKQREATQHARMASAAGLALDEYHDKTRVRSAAENAAIESVMTEDRAAYIADCVMGVGTVSGARSLSQNMTVVPPETLLKLRPDVLRTLSEFIVGFCRYGVNQREFFRSRDGAAV